MDIKSYLDSTYLKLPAQSGLTSEQTWEEVKKITEEAISNHFFLVMIRPEYVQRVKKLILNSNSKVQVGTVIGFHEGTYLLESKLKEAKQAIQDGADELDYVINYTAFKNGDLDLVKEEFVQGTSLGLKEAKIVKWIIEIAALSDEQIQSICSLMSQWAQENFDSSQWNNIFIKSSTGFYQTEDGKPNGATFPAIEIMLKYSQPLPVKAAGGVRTYDEAVKMIKMGVKRIGTSSAKALSQNEGSSNSY
ncbi:deoxyribose-phosphate aldolase [Apibacter raozihei]|uniref:deoxyribose-phosphate aldolase n=1 Tax=Apibacter raozihei TaxID=2500547 RepID=UPI000FE42291|nr:deoxyribose-phosphate aldolase [Apibacter raozihei]